MASEDQPALPRYRPDIDGLRALAVCAVIGFHAFPELLPGGFVGVDVFFVISGYLISGILLRGSGKGGFSFREFYGRRIRRIFPALILVMASTLAVGFAALSAHEFGLLNKHIAGGAGFAANFVLWNEAGYFDAASATKPLLHLWSLGIEEQFYIVWPPLLYLIWRSKSDFFKWAAFITAASFLFNLGATHHNAIAGFYSPLSRFWELSAGAILAGLDLEAKKPAFRADPNRQNIMSAAGLSLILIAVFAFDRNAPYPGWRAAFPVAGAWLLLAAGSSAWVNRTLLSRTVAVWLGLISFPLYLWHWPLLFFMRVAAGGPPDAITRLAAIIATVLLAALTYRLVEKPIRFGPHRREKTAALCLLMILLGCFAFYEYKNGDDDAGTGKYADQLKWTYWNNPACAAKYGIVPCQANSDRPEIMILGDSHANALYPGFALTEPKTKVIATGTCLPLDGVNLHVKKNQSENPCETADFLAIDKRILKENPGIKTVIVSARWRHILTGEIQNPHEKELWGGVWLSSIIPGEENKNGPELIDLGLARTIRYLRAQNLKVAFIRETPELDPELPDYCHLLSRDAPSECAMPETGYLAYRKQEDKMIATLRREFPGLPVYDPAGLFCDGSRCGLMKNGVLLFRDNHHLSVGGSAYLAKDIKAWMEKNGLLD